MVILACPVIVGYFYVCAAGCFELIFHGSLETARAPVLYRLPKTFLPFEFTVVINSCLFRPFHESGGIFWLCDKCISEAAQAVYILIYGKLPVGGIYAAEFRVLCFQLFVMPGVSPLLLPFLNGAISIIILQVRGTPASVHGTVIKSFQTFGFLYAVASF